MAKLSSAGLNVMGDYCRVKCQHRNEEQKCCIDPRGEGSGLTVIALLLQALACSLGRRLCSHNCVLSLALKMFFFESVSGFKPLTECYIKSLIMLLVKCQNPAYCICNKAVLL